MRTPFGSVRFGPLRVDGNKCHAHLLLSTDSPDCTRVKDSETVNLTDGWARVLVGNLEHCYLLLPSIRCSAMSFQINKFAADHFSRAFRWPSSVNVSSGSADECRLYRRRRRRGCTCQNASTFKGALQMS